MQQNYCYQCCLADICKHVDRGTHTLASPACDAFDPGMRWIPVTERLPEEWEPVLVRSKFGFSEVAWYIGIGKWRYTANACLFEDGSVTHWMPLPEPPADEKEE